MAQNDFHPFVSQVQSLLATPDTNAHAHHPKLQQIHRQLWQHGQPTALLSETGSDIFHLILPYAPPSRDCHSKPHHGIADSILCLIAQHSHPRELCLFIEQILSTMEWLDCNENSLALHGLAERFIYLLNLYITPFSRLRPKRPSAFLTLDALRHMVESLPHIWRCALSEETDRMSAMSYHSSYTRLVHCAVEFLGAVKRAVGEWAKTTLYDDAEKRKQDSALLDLGFSISDNGFARIATLTNKPFIPDAILLLDTVASLGVDVTVYIHGTPETPESFLPRTNSILCLLGLAMDCEYPLESLFPSVLSPAYLLEEYLPNLCLLLERLQEDDYGLSTKAARVTQYLVDRHVALIKPEKARDADDLILKISQNLLLLASTIPTAASRTLGYCTFKTLVSLLPDESRAHALLLLLESSPFAGVQTAILSVLKDQVHRALSVPYDPQVASPFGSMLFTKTFLSLLLDAREYIYTGQGRTVFDDDEVFMERHGMLMHTINLYLYLLLRDTPRENRMGVWSEDHLEQSCRIFLDPLRKRCEEMLDRLRGASSESQSSLSSEESHVHLSRPYHDGPTRIMMVQTMQFQISRVLETIEAKRPR
ncbi:hypothetical protein SeLEV6574_g01520 [Synchytrium endobioticum]|uniref:Uncharacterized protein n=1 Tax=Synchytrium endobioticum TaxID=286115 RepID=A0A507DCR7_9FUNG|nr:hypothetical protein SeLEV6574_g01520 [Synchytrium endobioticum]